MTSPLASPASIRPASGPRGATWKFDGHITVVEPNTATQPLGLRQKQRVIRQRQGALRVGRKQWTIEGSYGSSMIYGKTHEPDYFFVICRGSNKIKGMVYYDDGTGDGQDPGTWEADESGDPGGGRKAFAEEAS